VAAECIDECGTARLGSSPPEQRVLELSKRPKTVAMALVASADSFQVRRKLGAGSFGDVYLGKNIQTGEDVAIKVETKRVASNSAYLKEEVDIYKKLAGGFCVPRVHFFGQMKALENSIALVMDLLGLSLQDLFESRRKSCREFSSGTVVKLGIQMISCLQYVHDKGVVHRDIKPENFVMGLGPVANRVHIIDFGLATSYIDASTQEHLPPAKGRKVGKVGTRRYASLNAHREARQSRRDDLESIGYVLIFFVRGRLPWQGLKAHNENEHWNKILKKKESTPLADLCTGFSGFEIYLEYCRGLRFDQQPDYNHLRQLIKMVSPQTDEQDDFDWARDGST